MRRRRILLGLRHPASRKPSVGMLHHVALEKLLTRPPIDFDPAPIKALVAGRRVLVTGAGGSIGSELCRQLAELAPASLVMLDRYENGLHAAIAHVAGRPFVNPVVGDITDAKRLRAIFEQSRPHLVLHAAAHKHVPLMEANPCEAVKNNVTGTRCVAEAAERVKTERFVLISTDKAVRPSSVMGATKRVAELLMDQMTGPGGTAFVTVRFGNVLGSNGSVLPRFLEQINDGGPVTVTHPEMRRYFMLLSEAVHLVLRAAAFNQGPPVCVLDLGDQVRVLDLARYLIRLAGFVPEKEIPIVFTGLRPGEKLSEELVDQDEDLHPSLVKGIFAVRRRDPERLPELGSGLKTLEAMAAADDEQAVIAGLCALVPGFAPGVQWAAISQQRRRLG